MVYETWDWVLRAEHCITFNQLSANYPGHLPFTNLLNGFLFFNIMWLFLFIFFFLQSFSIPSFSFYVILYSPWLLEMGFPKTYSHPVAFLASTAVEHKCRNKLHRDLSYFLVKSKGIMYLIDIWLIVIIFQRALVVLLFNWKWTQTGFKWQVATNRIPGELVRDFVIFFVLLCLLAVVKLHNH